MSMMEILWTFSIYLESVAMVPQLFMIKKLPFQDICLKEEGTESSLEEDFGEAGDGLGQYVPIVLLSDQIDDENNKIDNIRRAYLRNKLTLSSTMVCHFTFCLGLYRLCYIFNWVYRYNVDSQGRFFCLYHNKGLIAFLIDLSLTKA